MMDNLIEFRCIYCKHVKPIKHFINKKNKIVKTCDICRDKNKKYQNDNQQSIKEYKSAWHKETKSDRFFQIILNSVKNRAIKKNLDFDLDEEYLESIDNKFCPYFNFELKMDGNIIGNINSKSLDRIDNNKDYIKGNVEFISNKANVIKNNSTIQEQLNIVYWLENFDFNYKNNYSVEDICIIYDYDKLKALYKSIKKRSKKEKVCFNISLHYFLSLLPKDKKCPALGIDLIQHGKCYDENLISVDKIIPSLGYVENNIAIISKRANTLKSYATLDELKIIVNRRIEMQNKKSDI